VAAPTLLQFEDGLLARLNAQLLPAGPFRRVEVENGQLIDAVREGQVDSPSVFVHLASAEDEPFASRAFQRTVQLQVFVVVMNYRGGDQARRGVGAEVGAMAALEQVHATLAGQDLGLEIHPLRPLGFHALLPPEQRPRNQGAGVRGPVAAYRADFEAVWEWTLAPTDEQVAAVDHTHSTVDIDHQVDADVDLSVEVEHPEAT
jgi:phage gp37-like protein